MIYSLEILKLMKCYGAHCFPPIQHTSIPTLERSTFSALFTSHLYRSEYLAPIQFFAARDYSNYPRVQPCAAEICRHAFWSPIYTILGDFEFDSL